LHDEYRFNWPSPLSKVERWEGKREHAPAMLAKWRGRLDTLQGKSEARQREQKRVMSEAVISWAVSWPSSRNGVNVKEILTV
jgi:hypothetical protein